MGLGVKERDEGRGKGKGKGKAALEDKDATKSPKSRERLHFVRTLLTLLHCCLTAKETFCLWTLGGVYSWFFFAVLIGS